MSQFSRFMKANKIPKENKSYAPTASLTDENGKPLEWTFRHITSAEHDNIRDRCTVDMPVTGKPNMYRPRMSTSKYLRAMVAAATVYPDLYDKELQESYGANTPEELVQAMVDDPGEYTDLIEFVQKMNGFDISPDDKVEEAKN